MRVLVSAVLLVSVNQAFSFLFGGGGGGGGGGGCGCSSPCPAPNPCPPPCPPQPAFQMPQFQLPKFELPKFELPQFELPNFGGSSCCTPSCSPPCPPPSCGCKRKRRDTSGAWIEEDLVAANRTLAESTNFKGLQCNNEYLRRLILNNLKDDSENSKLAILSVLRDEMKANFGVICTEASFTYAIDSQHHCLEGNDKVHCYVFM